ncbi:uncharacterized protein LOC134536636 [Bacillus rossius redtenbacheri]|uniref:uncharacterized protein LOC134536636 n=1 Tax=Bacillus rossius redtenbacheri TaxID=93214 RepID=UPI002FDEADE2
MSYEIRRMTARRERNCVCPEEFASFLYSKCQTISELDRLRCLKGGVFAEAAQIFYESNASKITNLLFNRWHRNFQNVRECFTKICKRELLQEISDIQKISKSIINHITSLCDVDNANTTRNSLWGLVCSDLGVLNVKNNRLRLYVRWQRNTGNIRCQVENMLQNIPNVREGSNNKLHKGSQIENTNLNSVTVIGECASPEKITCDDTLSIPASLLIVNTCENRTLSSWQEGNVISCDGLTVKENLHNEVSYISPDTSLPVYVERSVQCNMRTSESTICSHCDVNLPNSQGNAPFNMIENQGFKGKFKYRLNTIKSFPFAYESLQL